MVLEEWEEAVLEEEVKRFTVKYALKLVMVLGNVIRDLIQTSKDLTPLMEVFFHIDHLINQIEVLVYRECCLF